MRITRSVLALTLLVFLVMEVRGQDTFAREKLKATDLDWRGDLSEKMVMQIDTFLTRKTRSTRELRQNQWLKASQGKDRTQYEVNARKELKKIWGMGGERKKPHLNVETAQTSIQQVKVQLAGITIFPVTIQVTDELEMKGILLQPNSVKARLVMVPDADQTPEELAGIVAGKGINAPALRMAMQGVQVLIPALISRKQVLSGSPSLGIYTNQPHREWIYRQSNDLGLHIIGYELQKITSCIDWFAAENAALTGSKPPLAIAGYGEGGMLALFTAATDTRLAAALVSGYLETSESLCERPIYRNLHGNLRIAGNAELLAMSAHGKTIVEYAEAPAVVNPALIEGRRGGAAPGRITTPPIEELNREIKQAKKYGAANITLVSDSEKPFRQPFSTEALNSLGSVLSIGKIGPAPAIKSPAYWINSSEREATLFRQMGDNSQMVLDTCEKNRNRNFWAGIKNNPEADAVFKTAQRERLHQLIGKISDPLLVPAPRARLLESNQKWRQYEVVLDVWDGVFAWGILTVPVTTDDRKMPVVVCQHGLEGLPKDMISTDPADRMFSVYKAVALGLAEKGYVTFAPHNPYRGEDKFRTLQRKANPIGLSLFSVIAGQHQQIVNWLGSLAFVEPSKIGFYGLSYGGKTAMRIPALVEGYALSICSGDFNEWIRKVSTTRAPFSYQFTKEYEIYEWDLGNNFNYAEMAALIAPRPFMVEYGYKDGIATAEWVGYEFAKVRKHYDISGLGNRVDIDLFNGVHEINATKTYPFLDRHLKK